MLINGFNVLANLKAWRVLWLDGHLRGGKTSLAFRLGYELLMQGEVKYLCSNIPNVWNSRPSEIPFYEDTKLLNTVFIADEGGHIIRNSKDSEQYITGLGKLNAYLIVPSRRAPSSDVTNFRIQRVINLSTIGINAWFYKYLIKDGFQKDDGWFIWYNPGEIFGVYDTDMFPVTDGGIGYALEDAIEKITVENKEERERFQSFKRRSTGNTILFMDETIEGVKRTLEETQNSFDDLSAHIEKIKKRRRI